MQRRAVLTAALLAAALGLAAGQIGPGMGTEDGPIAGAELPMYQAPDARLADACEAGKNIRLANYMYWNQQLRPFDAPGVVTLVVIDLQPLFNDVTSPWGSPDNNATYWRLLPQVEALTGAISEYCDPQGKPAGKAIFTQFITSEAPLTGQGTWKRYYAPPPGDAAVTIKELEKAGLDAAYMLGVTPEVQAIADAMGDNAKIVNKTTAGAFSSKQFREALKESGAETLVVMGVETDYCVIATVLVALDEGIRTIVVTDGLGSSQPNSGQATLDYIFRRFPAQLELATTDQVVAALQAAACKA